jgi:hypothetical protein
MQHLNLSVDVGGVVYFEMKETPGCGCGQLMRF